MKDRNAHCGSCGYLYEKDQDWPRTCSHCRNTAFRNPLPVVVVLLPVDGGLLTIRRNIEPRRGELALPGGYINFGEDWRDAGARELFEETGIQINPKDLREHCILSTPDGSSLLIFAVAPELPGLPAFIANDECSEQVVIRQSVPLAFPLHEQVVQSFFQ